MRAKAPTCGTGRVGPSITANVPPGSLTANRARAGQSNWGPAITSPPGLLADRLLDLLSLAQEPPCVRRAAVRSRDRGTSHRRNRVPPPLSIPSTDDAPHEDRRHHRARLARARHAARDGARRDGRRAAELLARNAGRARGDRAAR